MRFLRLSGLCALASTVWAGSANTFNSPTAGFAITKPDSWKFMSLQSVSKNRATARMKDKELERRIREKANAPLVAITRFREPYDDLNPSVQVMLRPLGQLKGTGPVELMKIMVAPIQKAFSHFEFVQGIKETNIDGMKAAHMRAKYTVSNDEGRVFPTLSRIWVVPRGDFMFMISMSSPQEGPSVSEKEFSVILKSIKFRK